MDQKKTDLMKKNLLTSRNILLIYIFTLSSTLPFQSVSVRVSLTSQNMIRWERRTSGRFQTHFTIKSEFKKSEIHIGQF